MILDIGQVLRGEVNRLPISYTLPTESLPGVSLAGEAQVAGEVTDNGGYLRLTLTVSVAYRAECARCLEPVDGCFQTTFERTLSLPENLTEEQIEENVDEYALIQDGKLDVDETVREEIVLNFPSRILCSEDCPGLCPKCGKPLKTGACSCQAQEPDPRWAALSALLDQKEDGVADET